jgi:serine/threonine protein phosphatase 1
MKTVAIIGDIHGDVEKLRRMLLLLEGVSEHTIFVGDYLSGMPFGFDVIETLSELRDTRPQEFTFLIGNHELDLIEYLRDKDFVKFASRGGLATLNSYIGETRGNVFDVFCSVLPPRHREFLFSLDLFVETDRFFVSHAGIDPTRPLLRDPQVLVRGVGRVLFEYAEALPKQVICGHYRQHNGQPLVSTNLICLDTGCGYEGPLTSLLLPEGRILNIV